VDDAIDEAVLAEEFAGLEAVWQLNADGLLDHTGPAKPIRALGSAKMRSPSEAKLAATPPIVGE